MSEITLRFIVEDDHVGPPIIEVEAWGPDVVERIAESGLKLKGGTSASNPLLLGQLERDGYFAEEWFELGYDAKWLAAQVPVAVKERAWGKDWRLYVDARIKNPVGFLAWS